MFSAAQPLLLRFPLDRGIFLREYAPHISPHLPTSPHISPHLPTSPHIPPGGPHISPYLTLAVTETRSVHISPYLPISPHISPHLPTSPHISQVNDPSELIAGFEAKHLEMIKAMRGVPGVLPERFAEAAQSA